MYADIFLTKPFTGRGSKQNFRTRWTMWCYQTSSCTSNNIILSTRTNALIFITAIAANFTTKATLILIPSKWFTSFYVNLIFQHHKIMSRGVKSHFLLRHVPFFHNSELYWLPKIRWFLRNCINFNFTQLFVECNVCDIFTRTIKCEAIFEPSVDKIRLRDKRHSELIWNTC